MPIFFARDRQHWRWFCAGGCGLKFYPGQLGDTCHLSSLNLCVGPGRVTEAVCVSFQLVVVSIHQEDE